MKKIKKNEYRCSCCDKIKPESNQTYVPWSEDDDIVAICHECNMFMKAYNIECVDHATDLIIQVKHMINFKS